MRTTAQVKMQIFLTKEMVRRLSAKKELLESAEILVFVKVIRFVFGAKNSAKTSGVPDLRLVEIAVIVVFATAMVMHTPLVKLAKWVIPEFVGEGIGGKSAMATRFVCSAIQIHRTTEKIGAPALQTAKIAARAASAGMAIQLGPAILAKRVKWLFAAAAPAAATVFVFLEKVILTVTTGATVLQKGTIAVNVVSATAMAMKLILAQPAKRAILKSADPGLAKVTRFVLMTSGVSVFLLAKTAGYAASVTEMVYLFTMKHRTVIVRSSNAQLVQLVSLLFAVFPRGVAFLQVGRLTQDLGSV